MSSNKVPSTKNHFSGHNCILTDVQLNITGDASIMSLKKQLYSECCFFKPKTHMVHRNKPTV